jgi:uncharacterized protein (TIGR03435 family)
MIPSELSPFANHVWQSTLFAAAAWLLTLLLRANRAEVRYWIWLAASVKFLIPCSLLVDAGGLMRHPTVGAIAPLRLAVPAVAIPAVVKQAGKPFTPPPVQRSYASVIVTGLVLVWAIGFVALLLRWILRLRRMHASVRNASPHDLPIGFPVRSSPDFGEPGVFGVIRPVLLLPDGIVDSLTAKELGAIVVHELCHIRRCDNLASAVHMAVEALFWFHPLVWWLGARLLEERERACDEDVLRRGVDRHAYAEGILKVCELYLASPLACVAGVTGGDLKRRIQAIMSDRAALRLTYGKKAALTLAGLAALAMPVAVGILRPPAIRAQEPEIASPSLPPSLPPAQYFDVASIKSIRGGQNRPLNSIDLNLLTQVAQASRHGRFQLMNATLGLLMELTYGVQDFGFRGGPAWIHSDRYEVIAKTDRDLTFDRMRPMLHSLLAERFKLQLRKEWKQMPIYELAVAKGGLKIAPSKEGSCLTFDPDNPPPPPWINICGHPTMRRFPDGRERIDALSVTMPTLIEYISQDVRRPVAGNAHFYEKFDLHLEFIPTDAAIDAGASGVPIATALQEQLGLELKSHKGVSTWVLVIDHVEKPSEN